LTAFELIENQNSYDTEVPSYTKVVETLEDIPFKELIKSATTNGAYADIHHVYALSAAMQIAIESYCPASEMQDSCHPYTTIVYGRGLKRSGGELHLTRSAQLSAVGIMWTMLTIPKQRSCFRSEVNHIVYLARLSEYSSICTPVINGVIQPVTPISNQSSDLLSSHQRHSSGIDSTESNSTMTTSSTTSAASDCIGNHQFPKVCRNENQFSAWKKSRDWLSVDSAGNVKCNSCSQVPSFGVCSEKGVRKDTAFIDGTVNAKDAKTLLKKIDKHRDSRSHKKCCEIIAERKSEKIKEGLLQVQSQFEEQNKARIDVTCSLFRTAYECAKSHLSFTEYTRLIKLQKLNGLNCGTSEYSDHTCASMIDHVAQGMVQDIVSYIVTNEVKFSLMIDESTSVSNIQNLIIYIRTAVDADVHVYFLGLIPLEVATAAAIYNKLIEYLNKIGLTENIVTEQMIGFGSDGASCMIGEFKGVATLLKKKNPILKTVHCMAHRLELAVKNAVDSVNSISYFRDVVDCIYKVYSVSPKNQSELDKVADSLSIQLQKIKKVFDIRWVFSSYVAVCAIWNDFPALFYHFEQCSQDMNRCSKERSKFAGLVKKIQSWFFLAEMAMLKDALCALKQFSHYLQSDQVSMTTANLHITDLQEKMMSLKNGNGKFLHDYLNELNVENGKFQNIFVVKKGGDEDKFCEMKCQFYQALHDNIEQRFPCEDLLKNALVLNAINWPSDALDLALYGDREIASLCSSLCIDSLKVCDILSEFIAFKKTKVPGKLLADLIHMVETYPLSTAACERGFSQMNLCHTKSRNCLSSERVNSLLMININGPNISEWDAKKYVVTWLMKGHKSALDKPSRSKSANCTPSITSTSKSSSYRIFCKSS
jgi:hypothetical protein